MVVFVDFIYYSTIYKGILEKEDFDILVVQASSYINEQTFGRVTSLVIPEKVKYCTCVVTDHIYYYKKQKEQGNKKSESVDKWKITYDTKITEKDLKKEINAILKTYLWDVRTIKGVPILYIGV